MRSGNAAMAAGATEFSYTAGKLKVLRPLRITPSHATLRMNLL
jgi:hypothetical protein